MVCVYLTPVFINNALHAGPVVFGFAEAAYSFGAVLAGLTIPWLSRKFGLMRTLLLTVACYTLAAAVNPVFLASLFSLGRLFSKDGVTPGRELLEAPLHSKRFPMN